MKRAVFLAFAALTLYLSAMYRSTPLMLLFLTEMLLTVCMWILSRYLKRNFTVVFPEKSVVGEKGEECWCDCDIVNSGRLPASRYRIRVRARYLQEARGTVKFLHGASEPGTDRIRFGVRTPYCGMICLEFDRMQIYDYLALFSGKCALRQELRIAILPPGRPLPIEMASFGPGGSMGQERAGGHDGDAANEVRQIREYRPGDSARYIHWNQSARTDRIWIKEYEKETDSCVSLFLEIDASQWIRPKAMDGFYRLLHAVVLGLLQKVNSVKVHWHDGCQDRLAEMEILNQAQCQELFLCLYQIDFTGLPDKSGEALEEAYSLVQDDYGYFRLDTRLSWYLKETLICRFSLDTLEQEMANTVFTL